MTVPSPSARRGRRRFPRRFRTQLTVLLAVTATIFSLTAASCTPTNAKMSLNPGETLNPGESIWSENGYQALMQTDGIFVIVKPDGTSGWHTPPPGTAGSTLTLQTDGNLVLKGPDGTVLWQTHTASTDTVPAQLIMRTDGLLSLNVNGTRLWSSAFGNSQCYGSGCPVLSTYETGQNGTGHSGSLAGRDCGYSQPIGTGNTSLWWFCDTPTPGYGYGFIAGSTAATGLAVPGFAPQALTELPNGDPARVLPLPTDLKKKDNATACNSDTGNPAFAAPWASGLALVPGTTDTVLVPYETYCAEKINGVANYTYWGNGVAEYNTTSKTVTYNEQHAFPGGAPVYDASAMNKLGSPVYDAAANVMYFYISCAPFSSCPHMQVYLARIDLNAHPASTHPWGSAANYEYWNGSGWSGPSSAAAPVLPSDANGNATTALWDSTVARIPALGNQYVMAAMTDFSGSYTILTAPNAWGPWTAATTGRATMCPIPTDEAPAHCYAYNLHAELSTPADGATPAKVALTMMEPTRGHVSLEMIPVTS